MDGIQFLKQEHQKAKAAFGKIEQASPQQRGQLWNELKPELKVHEQIEKACLYDPVARDVGTKDQVLADWERRHREQVAEVERMIKEIGDLESIDARWLERVSQVKTALESHIQEEEHSIWPRIAKVWDRSRLEQAGMEMAAMKSEKMRQVA